MFSVAAIQSARTAIAKARAAGAAVSPRYRGKRDGDLNNDGKPDRPKDAAPRKRTSGASIDNAWRKHRDHVKALVEAGEGPRSEKIAAAKRAFVEASRVHSPRQLLNSIKRTSPGSFAASMADAKTALEFYAESATRSGAYLAGKDLGGSHGGRGATDPKLKKAPAAPPKTRRKAPQTVAPDYSRVTAAREAVARAQEALRAASGEFSDADAAAASTRRTGMAPNVSRQAVDANIDRRADLDAKAESARAKLRAAAEAVQAARELQSIAERGGGAYLAAQAEAKLKARRAEIDAKLNPKPKRTRKKVAKAALYPQGLRTRA